MQLATCRRGIDCLPCSSQMCRSFERVFSKATSRSLGVSARAMDVVAWKEAKWSGVTSQVHSSCLNSSSARSK